MSINMFFFKYVKSLYINQVFKQMLNDSEWFKLLTSTKYIWCRFCSSCCLHFKCAEGTIKWGGDWFDKLMKAFKQQSSVVFEYQSAVKSV